MADVKYTIEVDGAQFNQALNKLNESVEKLAGNLDKSSDGAKKSGTFFTELNSALNLARQGAALLGGALSTTIDSLKRGSDVADVAEAFDNLASRAGAVSDVLLTDLRSAAGGTIDDFKLMQQANELLNAGLDPSSFDDVIQAARRYADSIAGDATVAVDQLVTALKRGDDKALKTQGILIDNEKAYKDYAATINTTAEKLTELGKAEAIRAAATAALIARRKEFGDVENDLGDNLQRVGAIAKTAFDKFFEGIATNENLTRAVGEFADSLERLINGGALSGLVKEINLTVNAFLRLLKYMELGAVSAALFQLETQKLLKPITQIPTSFSSASIELGKYIGNLIKGKDNTQELITEQAKERVELEEQAALIKRQIELGNEIALITDKNSEAVKKHAVEIKKNTANQIDNTKGKKDDQKETKTEVDLILELERELQKLARAQADGTIKAEQYERAVAALADAFKRAGGDLSQFKEINERVLAPPKFTGSGFGKSFLESFLGFDINVPKTVEEAKSKLGDLLGQVARSTANDLADGKIAKNEFASLGATIGTIIGGVIGAVFSGGSGTAAGAAAGASIGSGIGAIVGELAAFLGSKDSAGTSARKEVDKFFAELFNADRLTVVVQGELIKIRDLVTQIFSPNDPSLINIGGNLNQSAFGAFESLPGIAQQAFQGVGKAFEEFLGVAEDISGQLGVIFAANLGGSINNLQLLIQATGASVEELSNYLIESFNNGTISAAEAHQALLGIQRTTEKGIPDGIGLVIEAFENLAAAGTNGGRAAIDALRDIASEALEKFGPGGTIEQVKKELIDNGKFTADEVERLFQLLAENGIDSLEELENASTEAIIAVLAKLEEEGKILQETGEKVKETAEIIEKIPDKTEKEVVFKVRVEFDEAAQSTEGQAAIAASGGQNDVSIPRAFEKTIG